MSEVLRGSRDGAVVFEMDGPAVEAMASRRVELAACDALRLERGSRSGTSTVTYLSREAVEQPSLALVVEGGEVEVATHPRKRSDVVTLRRLFAAAPFDA